jgi:hypothetical protein
VRISGYYSTTSFSWITTYPMGELYLQPDGELRIKPYWNRDFCVAHLAPGQWYWIEVHVDSEVMWDVRCTVFINGQAFGTYSNAYSWSEVGSVSYNQLLAGMLPNAGGHLETLSYGYFQGTNGVNANHDIYFTNTVAGRGKSETPNGPLQSKALAAADSVLGHYLPDWPSDPADRMELKTSGGGDHAVLYNWSHEEAGGPFTVTIPAGETEAALYTGIVLPRYWEPIAGTKPTTGLSEQSVDTGNAWSPVGQGRTRVGDANAVEAAATTAVLKITKFGQSVPVTAPISGIEVRVHRKATTTNVNDWIVQTVKGGVVGGTNLGQGSLIKWDTDWEVAVYGGEGELWGRTWTPQDINSDGFGVAIQAEGSGTAQVDMVTVKVYYADPGGPSGIGRGAYLPPIGLYNFVGDTLVAEWLVTGSGNAGHGWWSGGEPSGPGGGIANPATGTPSQRWTSTYPMWLWQARGDKQHEITVGGTAGDSITATSYRIVRNPYVFPRFAWSTDDGVTWTRILIGEDVSSNYISGDVGATTTGNAVFLDNVAAYDRLYLNPNGWDSGLSETRPSADYAHRYPYWYLAYTGASTTETVIHATNLWAKWRSYTNHPSSTIGGTGTFRAHAVLPDGSQRRIGTYSSAPTAYPSGTPPWTARCTASKAPDGTGWTQQKFNDLQLRLGYNQRTGSGAVHRVALQDQGAAVYGVTWEILVPASPDPPPAPCGSPKYGANITVKR